MKKITIYALLFSVSIMAHELLPRHDSPASVAATVWFAWAIILLYHFVHGHSLSGFVSRMKDGTLYIPVIYMFAQHAAMLWLSSIAEIYTAIIFIMWYAHHFYTRHSQ